MELWMFVSFLCLCLFPIQNEAFLVGTSKQGTSNFQKLMVSNHQKLLLRRTMAKSSLAATIDTVNNNDAEGAIDSSLQKCLLESVEIMNNVVMKPEFFTAAGKSSLKTLYNNCIKLVEIKESSIPGAGLGLFAKKNIKAGTIISFYPAHALGIENLKEVSTATTAINTNTDEDDDNEKNNMGNDSNGNQYHFVCLDSDKDYFDINPSSSSSSYLHCTDQPLFKRTSILSSKMSLSSSSSSPSSVFQDMPLYLDVNSNRSIIPGWTSQIINDGAKVDSNNEESIIKYYKESKDQKNCVHMPFGPSPIIASMTTKKVKKGDELFTTYGAVYWLGLVESAGKDSGGGGDIVITTTIQNEIKQTAIDLVQCMNTAALLYKNQLDDLALAIEDI